MDHTPELNADLSALRARIDSLERRIDFVLRHLQLTYDDHTESSVEDAAADALRRGDKMKAIMIHREYTGTGLKEAKEAVEALEKAMGLG